METDAKGQLGGLDTTAAERQRVAVESVAWTCGMCGRCNGEILKESADAAKAGEADEVEVPSELVLATKEDLEQKRGRQGQAEEDKEEAELAEGFVQTAPVVREEYPPARPAQSVSLPTGIRQRTEGLQQQQQQQPHGTPQTPMRTRQQQSVSHDGVPIWIDRAIAGLVICIVAMILKIVLGY